MMNLKYYLRGLGIGIVVTALIMGVVAGSRARELSDTEIKRRARELGMIEESSALADVLPEDTQEPITEEMVVPTQEPKAEEAEETEESAEEPVAEETGELVEKIEEQSATEPAEQPTAEPTEQPTAEPTAQPTAEPTTQPTEQPSEKPNEKPDGEKITVTINQGEGSYTICKRLEDAGLIFSASDFDHYLCEHGYDRKMRVGSFQIPADADPEQIAQILSGAG